MQNEFIIENISKYSALIDESEKAVRFDRIAIGLYSLTAALDIILVLMSQNKIVGGLWGICLGLNLINVGIRSTDLKDKLKKLNYLKEEAEKYRVQMDPLDYYNSYNDSDCSLSMKKK